MIQLITTCQEIAECLEILRSANGPIVAADIAARLGLRGKRETQRRHVRKLIRQLREKGMQIVASLKDGYRLTEDMEVSKKYLEGRQNRAKHVLGETHKKKKMLSDNNRQGLLFRPEGIKQW